MPRPRARAAQTEPRPGPRRSAGRAPRARDVRGGRPAAPWSATPTWARPRRRSSAPRRSWPRPAPSSVPSLSARVGTTILDDARGFEGNVTQPRTQSAFAAASPTRSSPPAAGPRRTRPRTRSASRRISAEETRRQVALDRRARRTSRCSARSGSWRSRSAASVTAAALEDYARLRLEAGQGSRLNFVRVVAGGGDQRRPHRAGRPFLRQAQEALGVAIFAGGPVDAAAIPSWSRPRPADDDAWLIQRPDVRLFTAELSGRGPRGAGQLEVLAAHGDGGFRPAIRDARRLLRALARRGARSSSSSSRCTTARSRRTSGSARPTGRARGSDWTRSRSRPGPSCGWPRSPSAATSGSWPRAGGRRRTRRTPSASPRSPTGRGRPRTSR